MMSKQRHKLNKASACGYTWFAPVLKATSVTPNFEEMLRRKVVRKSC